MNRKLIGASLTEVKFDDLHFFEYFVLIQRLVDLTE